MQNPPRRFRILFQTPISIAICLVCGLAPIQAEKFDLQKLEKKTLEAVNKAMPAVVAISSRGMVFSGVIVSKEGHIISAGHAVRPGSTYRVLLSDGRRLRAKGLGSNRRVDMAMLKITDKGDWPIAEMGHSSVLVKDQPCISISHPGRYSANRGAVVRFGRVVKPVTPNEGMIQTTAKMEPGDSGGPLFDLDAKVIGIHSNIRQSEAENYDVPIDSFRKHWDELNEPERFEINGWPSLPKLGFRGDRWEDGSGVEVLKVYEGGLAEASGLKPNDIVLRMAGKKVTSAGHVYGRLIELKSAGINLIDLSVLRDGKQLTRSIRLEKEDHPTPISFAELKNLPNQVKSLESRLDDNVFSIRSNINQKSTTVRATRIKKKGSGYLISKSSLVGNSPKVILADRSEVDAKIIKRDPSNDLVLLEARLPGNGGVDLGGLPGDMHQQRGKFLLTPDATGPGMVSVWGSKYFRVPRTRASGGYLGVQLDNREGQVLVESVKKGAAQRAGLKAGDVLVRLNETDIKRHSDATKFLSKQDPNSVIMAVIKRNETEITKEIILGNRPAGQHMADKMEKSARRDGFEWVISHDANIKPRECGSPVFDLKGEFLGINISRYSRTLAYTIPKTVLKKFVDSAG